MRNRLLRRSVFANLMSRVGSTVALIVATPLLVRVLGQEPYGVLMTLTATATLLALANLGVADGLVSRLSSVGLGSSQGQRMVSNGLALSFAAGVFALVVSAVAARTLPWPRWLNAPGMAESELRWATLWAFAGGGLLVATQIGQRIDLSRQRGTRVAAWSFVASVSAPGGAILAAVLGGGFVTVVAAASFAPPLCLLTEIILAVLSMPAHWRPRLSLVSREEIRVTTRAGVPFLLIGLIVTASYQIDSLVVSGVLGASAAAVFSLTARAFSMVGRAIQGSLTQLWAAIAEALAAGDVPWVRSTLIRSTLVATGVTGLGSVALIAIARPTINYWVSPGMVPSWSLLLSAAAWTVYSAAIAPLAMFLNGASLQRQQLMASIPMVLLNVPLSIVLTNVWGQGGPLLGSLIAHALCVAVPMSVLARRFLHAHQIPAIVGTAEG